jgi:hypothetical protein
LSKKEKNDSKKIKESNPEQTSLFKTHFSTCAHCNEQKSLKHEKTRKKVSNPEQWSLFHDHQKSSPEQRSLFHDFMVSNPEQCHFFVLFTTKTVIFAHEKMIKKLKNSRFGHAPGFRENP